MPFTIVSPTASEFRVLRYVFILDSFPDPLLLPARDVDSFLSNLCLVSAWQDLQVGSQGTGRHHLGKEKKIVLSEGQKKYVGLLDG